MFRRILNAYRRWSVWRDFRGLTARDQRVMTALGMDPESVIRRNGW